jgi:hypothetical protein
MHPDRRRRGRKNRRLARNVSTITIAFKAIGQTGLITAAGLLGFGKAIAAAANMQAAELAFDMLRLSYPRHHLSLERHDMTTVTITTATTAPAELVDALLAFGRDLDSQGIHVDLALTRTCIACGCTDDHACFPTCSWTTDTDDLCTACDTPAGRALLTQHNTTRHPQAIHPDDITALAGALSTTKDGQ